MPNSNPVEKPVPTDRGRQLERERGKSKRGRDDDQAARDEAQDTDPDSPDADINRDDMTDEP
jgi:hypothetical protein